MAHSWRDRYLRLLGLPAPPRGLEGLRSLVRRHVCRVPFENLSKLLLLAREGRGRPLDRDEFLDGIEHLDLGGTCYSNNPFLAELLRELDYDVDLLGADMSSPNVHTCLRVRLDGRPYHIDMGYGSPYYEPLPLDQLPHELQWGDDQRHVFERTGDRLRLTEYSRDHVTGYTAHDTPRDFAFFYPVIEASFLPGATFLNCLRICRFFGDRSVDLYNTTLTRRAAGRTTRIELGSLADLETAVHDEFELPRAPVAAAVAVLERITERPLFGIR